jgi:hypothetical protein
LQPPRRVRKICESILTAYIPILLHLGSRGDLGSRGAAGDAEARAKRPAMTKKGFILALES